MKVLLDTNAWLLPFADGTDLAGELATLVGAPQHIVPDVVVQELQTLAQGSDATARHARGALRLVQGMATVAAPLPGDDGILAVAQAEAAVIVTNDRRLQSEAARRGLRVIKSRETGRLAWR